MWNGYKEITEQHSNFEHLHRLFLVLPDTLKQAEFTVKWLQIHWDNF